MKKLLILSGKGGTGKTTIAASFISLSGAKAYADCDVDAPNLHLVTKHSAAPVKSDYLGMPRAQIDISRCIGCGICMESCRFDAIFPADGVFNIDPLACEGCSVCKAVCPSGAVSMIPAASGELMLFTDSNVFSTAKLKTGSGNSGKLVSEVKKQLRSAAPPDTELTIIDGSPGIGCPVIASLSGVDMVLIVTEPTVSGISDLKRIVKTSESFHVKISVCINKYDLNLSNSAKIEAFCSDNSFNFVGSIPYDPEAVRAVNCGKPVTDTDCPSGLSIYNIYKKVLKLLNLEAVNQ